MTSRSKIYQTKKRVHQLLYTSEIWVFPVILCQACFKGGNHWDVAWFSPKISPIIPIIPTWPRRSPLSSEILRASLADFNPSWTRPARPAMVSHAMLQWIPVKRSWFNKFEQDNAQLIFRISMILWLTHIKECVYIYSLCVCVMSLRTLHITFRPFSISSSISLPAAL